jgi:hypothetical protein
VRQRPIEEVRPQREHDLQRARLQPGDVDDRVEEQCPDRVGVGEREELLELVDDEEQRAVAGREDLLDHAQDGVRLVELVEKIGRAVDGDAEQGQRELLDGSRPGVHVGDEPASRPFDRARPQ